MSAKKRKYKFNVIDYLWYLDKDYVRKPKEGSTPFKAVASMDSIPCSDNRVNFIVFTIRHGI